MTTKSKTKSSTPRLSEIARHVTIPDGIKTTGWPKVKAKAAQLGIHYDPWQDQAHRITLGKRADGKYAATIGGITWSIPRQVGKTYAIGTLLLVMCILFPGYRVVWTAHHTRTSTSAFRSLAAICRSKKVSPHIARDGRGKLAIRQSNGEQEIVFKNGSMIQFGARATGFGRGFEMIDAVVFDEAQILTERALEDIVATTNQGQHVHGALLFYIGTPPRPIDPSEAFTLKRDKSLKGQNTDGVYLEFSADQDAKLDDRKQWAIANPSFPHRTPLESLLRLRANLSSDDAWKREGLGIWDEFDEAEGHPIDLDIWPRLRDRRVAAPRQAVIVIDVSPNRGRASIGVAGAATRDRTLVMVYEAAGIHWVVPKLVELKKKRRILKVALRTSEQAAVLIPDLVAAGIDFEPLTAQQAGAACGSFQEKVRQQQLVHLGQAPLDAAVRNAKVRTSAETEFWDRKDRKGPEITALVSAAGAAYLWGANKPAPKPQASVV